ALAGMANVEAAGEALARAIPLLDDPTNALVERAALSFHVGEHATAVAEVSGAIERHPLVPEYYEARALYPRFIQDQRGARRDEARASRLREASKGLTLEELKALDRDDGDDRPVSEPQESPVVAAERTRFFGKWEVVAREAA